MKKIFLPLLSLVFSLTLLAETKSGYTPFHIYFQNQHGNLQKLGNARNVIFKEIAYAHDTYSTSGGSWTPADSGVFNYSQDAAQVWQINGTYYNFVNPNWDTTSRVVDSVDANGFAQFIAGQNWSSPNWVNSYLYSYTYYTSAPVGYLNTQTLQTWSGSAWVDSLGYTYSYDSIGRLTKLVVQKGSSLQNDSQSLYSYTGWNVTNVITQAWSGTAWVNVYNQYNNFDANGNNIQSTNYVWNGTNWAVASETISSYSGSNHLETYYYYVWSPAANGGLGGYVNNYYESYQYVLDNNTQFENFNWDTTNNTWIPNQLFTYSFDGHGNVVYEQDQLFTNGAFANTDLYFYYYNSYGVSDISETQNELGANVFPNPSNGSNVFIGLHSDVAGNVALSVYDGAGKIVKQQQSNICQGANQLQLNLSSLATGNYYIQVADNNGRASVLKFVKQ